MTTKTRNNSDGKPGDDLIVVVGGGIAGLSAGIETAISCPSCRVLLVDKETVGGNSAKATSGMNGCGTKFQRASNISDELPLFFDDVMKSGQGSSDPKLVAAMVSRSSHAIDFLDANGIDVSNVEQLGGHSIARTHRPAPGPAPIPFGFLSVKKLRSRLLDLKNVRLAEKTTFTDLELENFAVEATEPVISQLPPVRAQGRRVRRIRIETERADSRAVLDSLGIAADGWLEVGAVILASGGYAADGAGLVAEVVPSFGGLPTTNGPFATGDAIKIARKRELATVQLENIQLHPSGFIDPKTPDDPRKFLCPEVMRGCGALLLATDGSRFVDELARRDTVSAAIRASGSKADDWKMKGQTTCAMLLMNARIRERFGTGPFDFYASRGLIVEAEGIAALEGQFGMRTLKSTLADYNAASTKGVDSLGKSTFPEAFDLNEKLYYAFVTPALHYTMGGLKVNADVQVISTDDKPVTNLFSCGEVTGGVHGKNRLGGNGLLDNVVFGRVAGLRAAATVRSSELVVEPDAREFEMTVRESENWGKRHVRVRANLRNPLASWAAPIGVPMKIEGRGVDVTAMTSPFTEIGFVDFLIQHSDDIEVSAGDFPPGSVLKIVMEEGYPQGSSDPFAYLRLRALHEDVPNSASPINLQSLATAVQLASSVYPSSTNPLWSDATFVIAVPEVQLILESEISSFMSDGAKSRVFLKDADSGGVWSCGGAKQSAAL